MDKLNRSAKFFLCFWKILDLTDFQEQNNKKPTNIAKSMPGRIKTSKHPFISNFHFLAVSSTAHPKKILFLTLFQNL